MYLFYEIDWMNSERLWCLFVFSNVITNYGIHRLSHKLLFILIMDKVDIGSHIVSRAHCSFSFICSLSLCLQLNDFNTCQFASRWRLQCHFQDCVKSRYICFVEGILHMSLEAFLSADFSAIKFHSPTSQPFFFSFYNVSVESFFIVPIVERVTCKHMCAGS